MTENRNKLQVFNENPRSPVLFEPSGIPQNQSTHCKKDEDYSLDKVDGEASRETKDG